MDRKLSYRGVLGGLTLLWGALYGCSSQEMDSNSSQIVFTPVQSAPSDLEGFAVRAMQNDSADLVFASSEQRGLAIFSAQGELLAGGVGDSKSVDIRRDSNGHGVWVLNLDESANQLVLGRYHIATQQYRVWEWPQQWEQTLTVGCLSTAPDTGAVTAWAISEEGQALQLALLLEGGTVQAREVRQLALGEGVLSCSVDDHSQRFFWSQDGVGVLSLNGDEEKDESRQLLAAVSPVGHLAKAPTDLQYLAGIGLLLTEADGGLAQIVSTEGRVLVTQSFGGELPAEITSVSGLPNVGADGWRWWGMPEEGGRLWSGSSQIAIAELQNAPSTLTAAFHVQPLLETEIVDSFGDAADDPEIWVNSRQPQQSRILATDKKLGLGVYDLQGKRLQQLPRGNVNNVDIRYGTDLFGAGQDVAMATNRTTHNIDLFAIDQDSGEVSFVAGELMDGSLGEPYGGCLFHSPDSGNLYAFINNKDGLYQQWRLQAPRQHPQATQGRPQATLVREFTLPGQPEGCVADDETAQLYMGEEDFGIWVIGAEPEGGKELTLLESVEQGHLVADIEGLSLYSEADGQGYLVVSSQGDNSYVLYDRHTHTYAGRFQVVANVAQGVDGSSETDGLAVTSANLGGAFSRGLLVVQDGRNRMPATRQNFKLVPWSAVEAGLQQVPPASHVANQ